MKLLVFTDLHANVTSLKRIEKKVREQNPDVIINLGDFTIFEQNIEDVLERLELLNKPVLIIHGNHEDARILQKLCKRYPNLKYVHRRIITINSYNFVFHGGGGFYYGKRLSGDKDFDRLVIENKHKLKGKLCLFTHAPPANTRPDYLRWAGHVGCTSYKRFIDKYKPVLALCGHLHENFGKKQKIRKTTVANPGPEGEIYAL